MVTKMKNVVKLMKNAVYDKTMANLRNRIDVRLVNNEKDYLKQASKPRFMSQKYLTMIQLRHVKVKLH